MSVIGRVEDINWRTTRLKTTDDTMIVIPNAVISEKTITNFMRPVEMSRFEMDFTIDFSVPYARAIELILEGVTAVTGEGRILADPKPSVRVNRTTPMGVEYRVRYRIVPREISPAKARHLVATAVLDHLAQAGIKLAYPRRDGFYDRRPEGAEP